MRFERRGRASGRRRRDGCLLEGDPEQTHLPIVLSRQNLPNPARGKGTGLAGTANLHQGAYVLADTEVLRT